MKHRDLWFSNLEALVGNEYPQAKIYYQPCFLTVSLPLGPDVFNQRRQLQAKLAGLSYPSKAAGWGHNFFVDIPDEYIRLAHIRKKVMVPCDKKIGLKDVYHGINVITTERYRGVENA